MPDVEQLALALREWLEYQVDWSQPAPEGRDDCGQEKPGNMLISVDGSFDCRELAKFVLVAVAGPPRGE